MSIKLPGDFILTRLNNLSDIIIFVFCFLVAMWHPIRLQYYCTTNSLVLLFLGMLVLLLFLEKLEHILEKLEHTI